MQREIYPASPAAGGGQRSDQYRAGRGRRFARLAMAAWAVGAILAGTALAQPQAQPLQPPPGPAPAFADDPRQGEQWLASYQGCIERHVAALAAQGGDVRQVAETAYGACQHIAAMAGVPVERREALQQAAWSYALQAALRRLEGEGGLAP